MSTLELDEPNPERKTQNGQRTGIGARIMRQLRRNNTGNTSDKLKGIQKPTIELKKKNLNTKAIEKLYMNKTLGRFKQTQLETIFEHEDETDVTENAMVEDTKVFGKRKIKRSVSCSDGINQTKTLKKKRVRRIQNFFGVHKKLKRISMKSFLDRLQASDTVTVTAAAQIAGA